MTTLLLYLAKVTICSAVLYGYYFIALRNHRFHQWNRYYLLLITIVSLLTPLLQIPLSWHARESSRMLAYTGRIVSIREAVIPPAPQGISSGTTINLVYAGIIALLLLRILINLVRILNLVRRSSVQHIPPYQFVQHPGIQAPFSFFSYIFWDQQTSLQSREGQQILRHELVHLQEKHSMDKLFMELVTAVCWINPFFLLIRRELSLVHEFLADKKAAGEEVAGYAQTILQMAFQSKQFSITNDFFHPPIKRRILMLTRLHTPRFSYLRRLLVLPLAIFIFCSLAFVAEKRPPAIRALTATLADHSIITAPPARSKEVFTFVEQPPVFKGGETALAAYLSKHIHYPKAALEKGISGIVYVQFQIDENGLPREIKTVGKTPGYGLDQEAVRVVRQMPAWIPGRHNNENVPVQFNLPVRFVLNESNTTPPSETIHTPAVAETPDVNFTSPEDHREIFTFVETPPTFKGGEEALAKYLSKNIHYPRLAQEMGASGTLFVRFLIEQDGSISDIATVGTKVLGYGLEEEAMRVVKAMPKWNPGLQNGRTVTVQFNLPIRFTLQE